MYGLLLISTNLYIEGWNVLGALRKVSLQNLCTTSSSSRSWDVVAILLVLFGFGNGYHIGVKYQVSII